MKPSVFAGSANLDLAEAVAQALNVGLGRREVLRFPDGELRVEVQESVRGHDVFLVQPTAPPVADNLLELLLLTDACRRAGAGRLTAVLPYFGYARQDRRATGREPVAARLIADLIAAGGVDRVVTVDLHTPAIEGFFAIPVEHLSAVPILAKAAQEWLPSDPVVVAPDLGAMKLAERYARELNLHVAVIHKVRLQPDEVSARAITGDVRGRSPVIVDDMISTGGTIEAASRALLGAGAFPEIVVLATHGPLTQQATERLAGLPLRRMIVSDSIALRFDGMLPLQRVHLGPLLADTIRRLHRDESLADLLVRA